MHSFHLPSNSVYFCKYHIKKDKVKCFIFCSGLDAVSLLDAEDILENAHNSLDELWRLDYPQSRMEHLLDIIANQITRYVQVRCY